MNKHPIDRKVFFVRQSDEFLSLNDILTLARTGKLVMADSVFDVDGSHYTAGNIVQGKAPKWAMTAEHDPMLYGLPTPAAENVAMLNEMLCEDDFLEMPKEPTVKTVKDYLQREPQITHMVTNTGHGLF